MFGGVLGALQIPVVANLAPFEAGLAKAETEAKAAGGGIGGAFAGFNPMMIAGAVAVGGLALGIKSVVDISEKWETSQRSLKQATDSINGSYQGAQREINAFIETNKRFIGSQSEVVDAYAALLRQGLGTTKAQDDLNLALDLSKLKHVQLAEAVTLLQQAEMGRGRALLPLGIQMKEFPVLSESQHQADVKLEAAEKAVEKATVAHTAALKAHGPHSVQAQASAKALAEANAKLAEAHSYAAQRAQASTAVHDLLHQKLDGGRKATSDLEQAQNQLGNTWQTFAHTAGPAFLNIFTAALGILQKVADAIGWVLAKSLDLQNAIGNIAGHLPVIGGIQAALNANPGFTGTGGRGGHRAFGGTVLPNSVYTVGEKGPETLVMGSQGGTIVPNGRNGGGVTVNINIAQGAYIDGPSVDRLANTIAQRLQYATGR